MFTRSSDPSWGRPSIVHASHTDRAEGLLGRDKALQDVGAFVAEAAELGGALLVVGEPGVGKTALLDAAARMASSAGAKVLRAGGVEFEADVSFAGLHQVLLPLSGAFAQLDATHADALNAALGFGGSQSPDRLVVSHASLALLRHAATAGPLVVIVDDLHWLDRASAVTLGFLARRLHGSGARLLAAMRSGEESFFERAGLREHELEALDDEAASRLMDVRFPALAPRVRQRVLTEAQGNPLALLELPAALSGEQRAALAALPAVLPPTRRLGALFASRVTALPVKTRQLLLLAALEGTGDLRVVQASDAGEAGRQDLAAAERADLARVDQITHRLEFRHPMIRSAVVQLSTDDERRDAHKALAELLVDEPDRQAWHLAEAAVGPDEHVAHLLEQMAHRILHRGDAVGAVAALTRASALSPRAADRSRRLAEAAYLGADVTGELRNVSRLLARARIADQEQMGSLQAAVAAAYLLLSADGDVTTAHRLLVGAIEDRIDGELVGDAAFEEALHTLLMVCYFGGQPEHFKPFYDAIERLSPRVPVALYLCSKTFTDPVRTAASVLAQLDAVIEGLPKELDPTYIVRVGFASVFVDRVSRCREALMRVARDGREGGAVASGINALTLLCWDEYATGQWEQADKVAAEGVQLCEAHGYVILSWPFRLVQALLAAARGDYETNRALCDDMIQWAAPRQVQFVLRNAWWSKTFAALTRGDFEEAYRQASKVSPPGTLASHSLQSLFVPMDLVQAAIRTGRHAEAAAHATAMRDANIAAISPRLALLAGASTAMTAPDDSALTTFQRALAIPGVDHWPFELAQVQLAYGERLRRSRARSDSRAQLNAALETFVRLRATPWVTRAAGELRATGQTAPRGVDRDRDAITPQEREIATLAADGLTNKQIGQQLFLSSRTVSGHLYRLFPKLGITSRIALRDALASLPAEPNGEHRS